MERASTDNNLNEVISQTVKHFQLTNKKQEENKMSDENISGVLNEIYVAQTGLTLLGNLVDKHEMDESFSILGAGDLILQQTEKIRNALETLEERYHLNELGPEIEDLSEKKKQRSSENIR